MDKNKTYYQFAEFPREIHIHHPAFKAEWSVILNNIYESIICLDQGHYAKYSLNVCFFTNFFGSTKNFRYLFTLIPGNDNIDLIQN